MSFSLDTLKETSKNYVENDILNVTIELTDEEYTEFFQLIDSPNEDFGAWVDSSFLHNTVTPVTVLNGESYTVKYVRGPSIKSLAWYVREKLKARENPVFLYVILKTVRKYYEFIPNNHSGGGDIVEREEISYILRVAQ